jgi:hypothetical protein
MDTLLEAGRYALEGVEMLFAFGTAALLSVGLLHAHQAAQHGAHDTHVAVPAADSTPDVLDHAA